MDGFAPLQAQLAQIDASPLIQGNAQHALNLERKAQIDLQTAAAQRKADADRRAQQEDADWTRDFTRFVANPSPAGRNYLMANHPERMDQIKAGWDSYNDGQKQDLTHASGVVISAIDNKRPDLALQTLDKRIAALKSSDVDTTETQAIRDMVASGDPAQMRQARGLAMMSLAVASGDKFDNVYSSFRRDDREAELQPERLRAQRGLADYRQTRADYADDQEEADIDAKRARAGNARSMAAKRDRGPATRAAARPSSGRRAAPAGRSPEAIGPDGKTYVVRGGKWVVK